MYFPPMFKCESNIYFINIDGDKITFDSATDDTGTSITTRTLDTTDGTIYDGNNVNKGKIITHSDDNNIPSVMQNQYFTTNVNGEPVKTWRGPCKNWCVSFTVWTSELPYGGCTGSCVGCTTCNGCYATIVTSNTCTRGCTSNCATGCTNGCTGGCTTACTNNFEGSYGCISSCTTCDSNVASPSPCSFENDECVNSYSVPQGKMIVCKGCNTLCNNCTSCTACVSNVTRQYCSMATTCSGCTTGTTLQVDDSPTKYTGYPTIYTYCKNGQNGLFENAIFDEFDDAYVNPEDCVGDFIGYYLANGHTWVDYGICGYIRCQTNVSCENNNTIPCTACFHSCDDLV